MNKEQVFVVTDKNIGWDNVVGVFSDKEYVHNTYSNDNYFIFSKTIDNSKYEKPDLSKLGRTTHRYKVIKVSKYKYNNIDKQFVQYDFDNFENLYYNIVDPIDDSWGNLKLEINEIPSNLEDIEILSLIADVCSNILNVDKDEFFIVNYRNKLFLSIESKHRDISIVYDKLRYKYNIDLILY